MQKLKLKGLKIQRIEFKPSPKEPLIKFNNVIIRIKNFKKESHKTIIFTNVVWLFKFFNKKWFKILFKEPLILILPKLNNHNFLIF